MYRGGMGSPATVSLVRMNGQGKSAYLLPVSSGEGHNVSTPKWLKKLWIETASMMTESSPKVVISRRRLSVDGEHTYMKTVCMCIYAGAGRRLACMAGNETEWNCMSLAFELISLVLNLI